MSNEGMVPRFAVWIEGVTTYEERWQAALLRLGVAPDECVRLSREAPCMFRGQLSLIEAEQLKGALRDAGARVVVRVDRGRPPTNPPAARVAVGTNPPPAGLPAAEAVASVVDGDPFAALEAPVAAELPTAPAEPLRDPTMLDLEAPVIVGELELSDEPVRFHRGSMPMPITMLETAPVPVPVAPVPPTVVLPPRSLPPMPARPPAVWKEPDMRGFRGALMVIGGLVLLGLTHCAASYRVDDRMHSFSAENDDNLEQELIRISRDEGRSTSASDIVVMAENVASRAGVKIKLLSVVELKMVGFTDAVGCRRGKPERNPGLPSEFMMRLNLRNTACSAPAWIVGFRAEITARSLWVKRTKYIEQYTFADNYVGQDGRRSGEWLDVNQFIDEANEKMERRQQAEEQAPY